MDNHEAVCHLGLAAMLLEVQCVRGTSDPPQAMGVALVSWRESQLSCHVRKEQELARSKGGRGWKWVERRFQACLKTRAGEEREGLKAVEECWSREGCRARGPRRSCEGEPAGLTVALECFGWE